jgi:hypothetical protein
MPLAPSDLVAVTAWAECGAMALTGRADRAPLGPPARLVDGLMAAGRQIRARSEALGTTVDLDWLSLLGERAALAGLARGGTTSCGGSTRLLAAADGWVAVSLARPSDVELIPAWLELGAAPTDPWPKIAAKIGDRDSQWLVERAALLGLPVGAVGERSATDGVVATRVGTSGGAEPLDELVVLDLSSLWAGPLCASLLGLAGARIVKVESAARPDGARHAGDGLFDLLNGGKENVVLDLTSDSGRGALAALIRGADVVVESARSRALEQLGIVAADVLADPTGPRAWVSITGHGRGSSRVAFGDDAAVAGGLVVEDGDGPMFCADAVADPVTGVVAAAAALGALAAGGRWLLDVAMAGVAAGLAGATLATDGVAAAPPRARSPIGVARPLGADTEAVLSRLAS